MLELKGGEFRGEGGDVLQVVAEGLPLAAAFREAIAFGVFGGAGVVGHVVGTRVAQRGDGSRISAPYLREWDNDGPKLS